LPTMLPFKIFQWSGSTEFLDEYASLIRRVFRNECQWTDLDWKHNRNPLGKSLIFYARDDQDKLAAARAFWRLPSTGSSIWQPCDTVTAPEYQRKGLFRTLTENCLDLIAEDALVVNFPNNSSWPAYEKLGWKLYGKNYKLINFGFPSWSTKALIESDFLQQIPSLPVDNEFIQWRFCSHPSKSYRLHGYKDHLLVNNGSQIGAVSGNGVKLKLINNKIYSFGYGVKSRGWKYYLQQCSIPLPANSRVAFYAKSIATENVLLALLEQWQVNVLMDTF